MAMKVKVIRSGRSSIAIQIRPDETVTVRTPLRTSDEEIERILRDKEFWIRKTIEKIREKKKKFEAEGTDYLTDEEIQELAERALKYIPERTAYFARIVGVDYGRITIRHQRTRWGSCSSKGNLNFNCLLMLVPPEIIDYVVVHELCHRKQMNHSMAFWAEVEKVLPDYVKAVIWLKNEGGRIMERQR